MLNIFEYFKNSPQVYKCHSAVLKRNNNSFRDFLSENSLKCLPGGKDSVMIEFENVKPDTFDTILRWTALITIFSTGDL